MFQRTAVRTALVVMLAVLVWAPAAVLAQSTAPPVASATLPSDADLRLKQAIQSSFRILPVQDGIILVPLSRRAGVDNVELRSGTIAVNGTVVSGAELRQRLARDADSILELSYKDVGAQRRLLLGTGSVEAAPAVEAARAEAAAETPSRSEPTEAEVDEPGDSEPGRSYRRVSSGRVRVSGSITVDEDEDVRGAVVAIGGDIEVNGRVRDEVVAVGGEVRLGPRAVVYGDVTSVGGLVSRDTSAIVRGQVNEIELKLPHIRMRPIAPWSVHVDPWWSGGPWRTVKLVGTLVRMGLFALLAALLLLLVPRGVERVAGAVRAEPWKAALVGFLTQLLFIPLLVVVVLFLIISIIGIPLLVLVPFVILALFVAMLLGFAGAALGTAHAARARFGWGLASPVTALIVGLLVIWGLTLTGRVISVAGGPFAVAGGVLLLVGFLVEYAAWTVGLGGTLLTRFGRQGRVYPPPVPPAEPPPADTTVVDDELSTGIIR